MVPNPVGVLKIAAVLHQLRETHLRDHIVADEFVPAEAFGGSLSTGSGGLVARIASWPSS